MIALVAGGTGFIGSHIVRKLVSQGIQVRILVRKNHPIKTIDQDIEVVYGDILDLSSLEACTRGADLIFSAFGILGRWRVPEKTYREVNREGVKNLLESCVHANIRQFIHISSAGVLGPLPRGLVADESFPYNPSNVYEKSKCEAEKDIIAFGEKYDIPYTIIRPEFVYGPGDMHVLGLFQAIRNKRFFMLGDGNSLLHPTYIDDLIQGINLCVNNSAAIGRIFLITGEKALSVEEMATTMAEEFAVDLPRLKISLAIARAAAFGFELVGRISGAEPAFTKSRVRFFTQNRAFSFEKARVELGYVPRVDFREGVKWTIRWYRDNGYL